MEYSKLTRINEYLNIEEKVLKDAGIYNGYIFLDSPLFLNPKLLNNSINELKNAEKKIIEHFEKTIVLLKNVKEYDDNDIWWRMVKKHFNFPEPKGTGLGTSINSIDGKGLTGKTAINCLKTFNKVVKAGIEDPHIYRLLYLVQENIGVDRISDMICTIIYQNLLEYTDKKISELNLECDTYTFYDDKKYKIFKRPNGKNLIFVPEVFLSEIPDIVDEYDIIDVINLNQEMKEYVSNYFEEAIINVSSLKSKTKKQLAGMVLNDSKLMKLLLNYIENESVDSYDYEDDPLGIYKSNFKLKETMDEEMSYIPEAERNSLHNIIKNALVKYRKCIEDLGINNELYYTTKNGKMRNKSELTAHRFFIIVLESIKEYNNFHFSFEPKAGNGQVEFVITDLKEIVLVEFKLNTNDLLHGYNVQLEEYIHRYEATSSFYVIIKIANNSKVDNFLKAIKSYNKRKEVFVVDGLIYPTPSKI